MNANTINTFLTAMDAHPLLERLFFASAELAVLAVAVALAITLLRIRSPRACAMLWLIVLAKPIVTLAFGTVIPVLQLAPSGPMASVETAPAIPSVASTAVATRPWASTVPGPAEPFAPAEAGHASSVPHPVAPAPQSAQDWSASIPLALSSLWLLGVAFLALSTLIDRIRLHRFMARTFAPSRNTTAALHECAHGLRLRQTPPLRVTTELESPAVVGWFRSAIVIPQWLNAPEHENALAWALRHELTHLKHRDPIANALRRLAQILFFFHPVTWWASRRWEAAVELACDRAVVRTDDDVTAYAEQLYAILVQARQQRQRTMATGLFATRTQINTRIAALLGNSLKTPARLGIAAAATLTLFAGTVFAVGGAIAEKELVLEIEEEDVTLDKPAPMPRNQALQAGCEALLKERVGAIVVLDSDTGAVLALATSPEGDHFEPPYKDAYQDSSAPGSIFKIVLAAAALEEGVISPETIRHCPGSFRVNGQGRAWGCWKREGHGDVDVTRALAESCDVYFYNIGLQMGVDRINAWARKLGLGAPTGIDLPDEASGLIPNQDWKRKAYVQRDTWDKKWYPGDTVNLSIGQGSARMTPLQGAALMAIVSNGGHRVTPRLREEEAPRSGEPLLSDATLAILRDGLEKCVSKAAPEGTGARAALEGVQILGKTGTAQVASLETQTKYASAEDVPIEYRDHGWFVASVSDRAPRIAVSVFVKHGGQGGTEAAEIARSVIAQAYGIASTPVAATTPFAATQTADLPARTLAFPEDRSLGTVWIGDPIDYAYTPDNQPEMNEGGGWVNLGEAKGKVEIPAGKAVWLDVGPKSHAVDLSPLASLPADGIQYLDLYRMDIGDDDLRHLAPLTGLEAISLYRTKVTDAGLAHIATLPNIHWLDLGATKIEGGGLGQLAQCKKLVHVDLNFIKLNGGPTARQVGMLTSLQWLNLSGCEVTGQDLKDLSDLTNLVTLDLKNSPIGNDDLKNLLPLESLQHLILDSTRIDEGYKKELAGLPNLKSTSVESTTVPEAKTRLVLLGGRVVNEEGEPVEGAEVKLYADYPNKAVMGGEDVISDKDGRWVVRLSNGWSNLMINVGHADYISDFVLGIRPVPPVEQLRDHTATLVMARGTTFSGTIADGAGKPIPGAYVLHGYYQGELDKIAEGENVTVADDEGRFTVSNLDKGRHDELTILTMNHGPEVIRLDYGASDKPINVTLGEGAIVVGTVKNARGEILVDAKVSIREWRPERQHSLPREAQTNEKGEFRLEHMPTRGQLTLSFRAKGYYGASLQEALPFEGPLEIALIQELPYKGRVLDANTGEPVPAAKVEMATLTSAGEYWWIGERFVPVEYGAITGRFTANMGANFDAVDKVAFVARVRAPGYRVAESTPLEAARLGEEVEIRLEPAPPVEGVVRGPDGAPLAGATVAWAREGDRAFLGNGAIDPQFVYSPDWFETSDAEGKFRFAADDKPGVLVATHDLGIAWLDLNGHEGPVALTLAPWVRVEGRLHGVTALTPVSYEIDPPVVAGRKDFFSFVYASVNTDESGNFVLDKLPPMPVTIGAMRRWEPSHGVTFNPKPGEVLWAEIGAAPGRVSGRFELAAVASLIAEGPDVLTDERHLTARAVPRGTADPTKGVRYIPEIESDGAFAIAGIPSGDYTLHVNVHATPPFNACGRGTPVGAGAVDFTVGEGEVDLGTVAVTRTSFPVPGAPAPEIAAKVLGEEKPWSLAEEKGKLVVLDFWATWCAPCVAAMPALKSVYEGLPADKVTVVGLNLDVDEKSALGFLEKKPLPWKQVYIGSWAENNAATLAYGVSYIPSIWILDADGKVLARDVKPEDLRQKTTELLKR